MSNPYRAEQTSKEELARQREEMHQRRLADAREVLGSFAQGEPGHEFAKKSMEACLGSLHVPELEREIHSLDLIIKSGDQSRELEQLITAKNLELLKKGEEPLPCRVPVSAATHLRAIREREVRRKQIKELTEKALIDVADYVMDTMKQIKKDAQQTGHTPPQAGARQAEPATGETKATPQVAATSKVG
jgi:hypothetical protein